jgi:hypothetical protein
VALSLVEPNVWAPVIAQVIAQAVMLVGALWAARLPLGFALSRSDLRELYRLRALVHRLRLGRRHAPS